MKSTIHPESCPSSANLLLHKEPQGSNSFLSEEGQDGVSFWEEQARELAWFTHWQTTFQGTFQTPNWFIGGELNACYNCLDRHLSTHVRDKTAIYWEGESGETRKISYLELYEEVCKFSNVLRSLGVQKGDRVAIYLPLIPEAVIGMLACARIGAIHTVIFGGVGEDGVRERVEHAEAKILLTANGFYRRKKWLPMKETTDCALSKGCPSIEHVIVVQRTSDPVAMTPQRDLYYKECVQNSSPHSPPLPVESEHPLFILYTSGSTGKPKGIYHSTGGYLTGVHATCRRVFDIQDSDLHWCTADVGWITGHSYVVYGPFMHGASILMYEGAFDTPTFSRVWELIEKYRVTIFYTAPTAIRTFIKWGDQWPKKADLSSLRLLASVGEPINPDVWLWYSKTVGRGNCPVIDTWFQTETGCVVLASVPEMGPPKPGSVSRALPGWQVDLLNEQGQCTSSGMVAIQSPFPSMMRGVYKDFERYLSTYWCKWEGRYYFAGDCAIQDEDGYFWITGRADDVMKISGHRIGTAEVESALVEFPSVAEAAVVGLADAIKGEEIWAFVILKKECFKDASEDLKQTLRASVAKKIGSYAAPHHLLFVQELPKTQSGKIMRRILKNTLENRSIGDTTTLENGYCLEDIRLQFKQLKS